MRQALEFYGIEFGRNGFCRCPFHREKTASFKIHHNKFKCFGCGVTGDLIDYVMMRDKCSLTAAVNTICADFKIDAKPTLSDLARLDTIRIKNAQSKRQYRALVDACMDAHETYLRAYDLLEAAAKLPPGKTPKNGTYVDAYFVLAIARERLTEAEYAVMDYARRHPEALPVPPQSARLPEKLKWHAEERRNPFSVYL